MGPLIEWDIREPFRLRGAPRAFASSAFLYFLRGTLGYGPRRLDRRSGAHDPFLFEPIHVGRAYGIECVTAGAVPGRARAGRENDQALFRSDVGAEIETHGHFTFNPLPEIFLRVIRPHVRKVLTVVSAPMMTHPV